ncbi:MAG: hypothetical protein SynsKO_29650 [Synoicihabitans sp.]
MAFSLRLQGRMKKKLQILTSLFALTFTAAAFTGCQTIKGAGQDIENAGHALDDAVDG